MKPCLCWVYAETCVNGLIKAHTHVSYFHRFWAWLSTQSKKEPSAKCDHDDSKHKHELAQVLNHDSNQNLNMHTKEPGNASEYKIG